MSDGPPLTTRPNRAGMILMAKPSPKLDDPEQSARFIALAQEVGAEGSPEEFGRIFRMVATATREVPKPKARRRRTEG